MFVKQRKDSSLLDRRRSFAVSIRRQKIQSYKKRIRQLNSQPRKSQRTIGELITQFQLQSNQRFHQLQENNPHFQLLNILFSVQESFLHISPPQCSFSTQVQIQGKSPTKFIKPEQQVLLYCALNHDLFSDQMKYKDIPRDYQLEVIRFLEAFIKRNNYHKVSTGRNFQIAFFNFVQLFLSYVEVPDLRHKLLLWVRGTEALALIQLCVDGTFLNFVQFQHIYDILLLSLTSQNMGRKSQAINIMAKNLRNADYDDIQSLLSGKSKLLRELLQFIDINSCLQYRSTQVISMVQKSIYCICLLLQTYDQLIVQITQQGAGYIGVKLLCSPHESQILGGLMMLSRLTNIQSPQTIQFLCKDHSICFIEQWTNVSRILKLQNKKIRDQLVRFFRNLVQYGGVDEVELVCGRFQQGGEGVVEFLIGVVGTEEDEDVVDAAAITLYTLARQVNQMRETVQIQENLVLTKIVSSKLKFKLQDQLIKRQNTTCQYIEGFLTLIKDHQKRLNYSVYFD